MSLPDDIPMAAEVRFALGCSAAAGATVMRYFGRTGLGESKQGGEPVSVADREADLLIRTALGEAFPHDGVLTEEHADDGSRVSSDRVWIVDPLDGTRDFLEGSRDFAVQVALAIEGRPVLGVILAPALEQTWLGLPGVGAWKRRGTGTWAPIMTSDLAHPPRIAVTRRRLGPRTQRLRRELPSHVLVRRGGCGLKAALVAEGHCDIYAGVTRRMKEWDLCAAHAVAEGAGAVCTDLAFRPLTYNRSDVVARGGFVVASNEAYAALRPCFEAAGDLIQEP